MTGLTHESVVLATGTFVLIAFLAVAFASRPASALPALLLVEMALSDSITVGATVGQFHLFPGDILAVALAAATLMRWQRYGARLPRTRELVVLLVILLLSLARGAAAFGLQPSVVAAREMLAMLTAATFFSTVRVTPQLLRALRNWLLLASGVLVLAAANFWFQRGLGTYAATGDRAINAVQALVVLETTVITMLFPPFRGPVLRWAVPLAGVVVVVLSTQRTVWASAVVAAAVLLVVRQNSRGSTSVAPHRFLVAAAVLGVVLLVAAGPPGSTRDLTAGYQQASSTRDSTFSWRLEGWSVLINRQLAGPGPDLLIGSPSGTGEDRFIDGSIVNAPAHSMYVSTLTMTGITGLALLVWVYISAFRNCRRRLRSPTPFTGQAALLFMALLALQLTYFVGYSSGALVGLTLGLACGSLKVGTGHPPLTGRRPHAGGIESSREKGLYQVGMVPNPWSEGPEGWPERIGLSRARTIST